MYGLVRGSAELGAIHADAAVPKVHSAPNERIHRWVGGGDQLSEGEQEPLARAASPWHRPGQCYQLVCRSVARLDDKIAFVPSARTPKYQWGLAQNIEYRVEL